MLASGKIRLGDLPPSSRVTRLRLLEIYVSVMLLELDLGAYLLAASSWTFFPAKADPVKEILLMSM
jgi:hypothetical protein